MAGRALRAFFLWSPSAEVASRPQPSGEGLHTQGERCHTGLQASLPTLCIKGLLGPSSCSCCGKEGKKEGKKGLMSSFLLPTLFPCSTQTQKATSLLNILQQKHKQLPLLSIHHPPSGTAQKWRCSRIVWINSTDELKEDKGGWHGRTRQEALFGAGSTPSFHCNALQLGHVRRRWEGRGPGVPMNFVPPVKGTVHSPEHAWLC